MKDQMLSLRFYISHVLPGSPTIKLLSVPSTKEHNFFTKSTVNRQRGTISNRRQKRSKTLIRCQSFTIQEPFGIKNELWSFPLFHLPLPVYKSM